MTTHFEASLRTGSVLTRTAPFPNDPPTALIFCALGISMPKLAFRWLPSVPAVWRLKPASCPLDLHTGVGALTHLYTAIYTLLHTHLHRFTHHLHAIYTQFTHPFPGSFFTQLFLAQSFPSKNLPLGRTPPPPSPRIHTVSPSPDRQKKSHPDQIVRLSKTVKVSYKITLCAPRFKANSSRRFSSKLLDASYLSFSSHSRFPWALILL